MAGLNSASRLQDTITVSACLVRGPGRPRQGMALECNSPVRAQERGTLGEGGIFELAGLHLNGTLKSELLII